jgi:thiol-disulfide isomerase/thioredoxin|nr:TlpA disulfide reductase family protein [Bacteroidales bacterium]
MYRLDLGLNDNSVQNENPGFIEFIWGNESFKIFANYTNLAGSVFFEDSEENRILAEFRGVEDVFQGKMGAIYPLLDRYPVEDDFFKDAGMHFIKLQEERDAYILKMNSLNPDLLASKIISTYRSASISPGLHGLERLSYIRKHFFDLAPINKPELLNAPVYGKKIIDYLKFYGNQDYSFGEQEDAFIQAVDVIMANVSGDPELRTYVVEFLLEGFESFGMEKIQTYIVDTYVDETCETDAVELAVERVAAYRLMAEGELVKDIFIRSSTNAMVRLSELDSDYTLVLFWATHCQHCMKMIPRLMEWYETDKPDNLEIFSVSIDTVKSAWDEFNLHVNPPWINTHEPMGWEGKSAEEYHIYATPTMFLLDRERRIIAKPYTFRDLVREVGKLE